MRSTSRPCTHVTAIRVWAPCTAEISIRISRDARAARTTIRSPAGYKYKTLPSIADTALSAASRTCTMLAAKVVSHFCPVACDGVPATSVHAGRVCSSRCCPESGLGTEFITQGELSKEARERASGPGARGMPAGSQCTDAGLPSAAFAREPARAWSGMIAEMLRTAYVQWPVVVAVCAGCAQQPVAPPQAPPMNLSGYSPAFRAGFTDGCDSARGTHRRDDQRFRGDTQYAQGWDDGRSICAKR